MARRQYVIWKNQIDKKRRKMVEFNTIYKALELVGIYSVYQGDKDAFHLFYEKETRTPHYFYRNRGIDIIFQLINAEDLKGVHNTSYYISKRSIRKTGVCTFTAKVYEGTDVIVDKLTNYFETNDFLRDFYINHIHHKDISEYLLFQHDCLMWYIREHNGGKAKYFASMKKRIEDRIKT